MKGFTAALLVAAVCLLAANGAVQASRIGPARQLQQYAYSNGLGEPLGLVAAAYHCTILPSLSKLQLGYGASYCVFVMACG